MPIEFKLTDLDELERDKAMKMKKWLTGLMAVALMWAGIAYADECTHETTRTYSYPNAITYTSTGDVKTHQEHIEWYVHTRCTVCQEVIERVYDETKTTEQNHNWGSDGVCYQCEQVNDCVHLNTETGSYEDNYRTESINHTRYHQYVYDVYKTEQCSDCGWILSSEYDYKLTEDQEHIWNEENICPSCNQQNTCTHTGQTTTSQQTENWRFESIDDLKYHLRKYDVYEITVCDGCGIEILREYLHTTEYKAAHSWNEVNRCHECGVKNICTHENAVNQTRTDDLKYTKIDAKTHLHTFALNTQKYCPTCYSYFDEREGKQYEIAEPHRYYGGEICEYCGYTCEHTDTQERKERDYTCTDLEDGLNHSVVEEIRYYIQCNNCDRQIGDYIRTETKEYTEEHGGKYYCQDCGFEAVCQHENETYNRIDWVDMRYVKIDENTHEVYGKTETYTYCSECDEYLSETKGEEEELLDMQPHSWNSLDACRYCDFVNPNPCTHDNTEILLKQVYGSGWMAQNDAMHAETVIYKEVSVCSDCGKTLGEISALKKVEKTEEHHFEYGTCWTCGYQNPCEHDGTTHTKTEAWGWREDPICIDDKTHKINATHVGILTYCDLCGDCIKEEDISNQWVVEEHRMWGDHCEWCDYKIDCTHENTIKKVLPSSDYLFCESISDNAHAATYILYSTDYCEDCDTLLEFENESDEVGMTKVNQPHNMVNHRCVECGYCEHPEKKIKSESKYLGRKIVKYNEHMHMGVETYAVTDICQLCGAPVEEYIRTEYGGSGVLTTLHGYDENGICRDCGYVNTCKHENAYRLPLEYVTTRYEDLGDEKQHKAMKWASSSMFCPDCRYKWDYQQETEPDVFVEDHYYSWDKYGELRDECSRCGYVRNDSLICIHESTEMSTEYGEYWVLVEYVDEQYHNEYCKDKYKVITCTVCGIELSREMIQEGLMLVTKVEHNKAKTCDCGYVNPCNHENTVIGIVGSFEKYVLQIDDAHHETIQVIQKGLRCTDCDEHLTELDEFEEQHTYAKHAFNKYGRCTDCNYVNQCKHIQTQINYEYSVYSCYVVSEAEHEIRQRIQEREECLSCGEAVRTDFVEDITERQKHIGNGYCSVCGYNYWMHEHSWEVLHEDRRVYSAKVIDALTHEAVIQLGLSRHCLGCGDYTSGEPQPIETVIEPHNFTDLGRCANCGYVNFCEHEETYKVQKPVFTPVYQMKDDLEHTYTANIRTETRCAICDQRLSYTAELNAECTEEHIYDNVADLICDLCGYEKELPEEVATPEPTPTETPEPTDTPAPTKKPGSGSSGGSGSGTTPSKPKDTATPTPEEALPKTGDTSLPMSFLLLVMLTSICGLTVLAKRKHN